MATWRDKKLPASFRGVEFYVNSHTYSVGRRNSIEQFPYRNGTSVEDLGLDADEFEIEAYVVATGENDNYFTRRDALINAVKQYGPGTLVHPYLGKVRVVVDGKVSVSETFREGGIARFRIKFVVAGTIDFPETESDPIRDVEEKALDLINVTVDGLADQLIVDDIPAWSAQQLYSDFVKFTNIANAYVSRIRNTGGDPLRAFKSTIDTVRSTVIDALQVPCQMAFLVVNVFDSVLAMVNVLGPGYATQVLSDCAQRVIRELNSSTGDNIINSIGTSMIENVAEIAGDSDTTGYGSTNDNITNAIFQPIVITTYDRAIQASNRLALVNSVKAMAIATAARVAIRTAFVSLEEANEKMNRILACIDYLILKIGDESASDPFGDYGIYTDNRNTYDALDELKSTFIQAMREKYNGLARETVINSPPDSIDALRIAYDKYGDLDRADEIFIRNADESDHPGFLEGTINIFTE